MDVDRYLTDEALSAFDDTDLGGVIGNPWTLNRHILRAALPGILAQHRADVLREAAQRIMQQGDVEESGVAKLNYVWAGSLILMLADEAVAE